MKSQGKSADDYTMKLYTMFFFKWNTIGTSETKICNRPFNLIGEFPKFALEISITFLEFSLSVTIFRYGPYNIMVLMEL